MAYSGRSKPELRSTKKKHRSAKTRALFENQSFVQNKNKDRKKKQSFVRHSRSQNRDRRWRIQRIDASGGRTRSTHRDEPKARIDGSGSGFAASTDLRWWRMATPGKRGDG
ncbi:hypothetical protein U1Q18_020416 [Sarracenia purpurea var. burkii]